MGSFLKVTLNQCRISIFRFMKTRRHDIFYVLRTPKKQFGQHCEREFTLTLSKMISTLSVIVIYGKDVSRFSQRIL